MYDLWALFVCSSTESKRQRWMQVSDTAWKTYGLLHLSAPNSEKNLQWMWYDPAQWGLFVLLSQCKCHRMLSAPNSTKNLQWMWVAITSYTIQALSPLCQFFNWKKTSIVNVSVIASTTRRSSALFSTTTTQVAVIACTPRGCTTRGSFATQKILAVQAGCCPQAPVALHVWPVSSVWLFFSESKRQRWMYVLVTACEPRGLLQLSTSPLQLQKELAVREGYCYIRPRLWAPSLSILQRKSVGASVIACTTRGSSACLLCNSKYLQCKQVIVTACTTRGLCFPVLQLKANSVQRWKQAPNLQWV